MAIFHCHIAKVSRKKGQSAVEAVAYALHADLKDQRTGERFCKVLHAEEKTICNLGTWLPDGKSIDPEDLWNRAELAEKRKDSITARTFEVALPRELKIEDQKKLATVFSKWLRQEYGIATTTGLHLQHEHNPHAHIVATRRKVDGNGNLKERLEVFDKKQTGGREYKKIRQRWATLCNAALAEAGHKTQISALSLKDQGIDREPQKHRGIKLHSKDLKELGLTRTDYANLMKIQMEEERENAKRATTTAGNARAENREAGKVRADAPQGHRRAEAESRRAGRLDKEATEADRGSSGQDGGPGLQRRRPDHPRDTRTSRSTGRRHDGCLAGSLPEEPGPGKTIANRIDAIRLRKAQEELDYDRARQDLK